MKIEVKTKEGEIITIDTESLKDSSIAAQMKSEHFNRTEELKWKEHCKRHHFNATRDAFGKIYEQYLRLCAEGLL